MGVRARSGGGWQVRVLEMLAPGAWVGLAYVVVELEPADLASRIAFFAALGLALLATSGLAAYGLSFTLFSDERYRGNLRRSLWQGAIVAGVGVAAALLQAGRLLTPLAGAALAGLFLIGQIAALLRE